MSDLITVEDAFRNFLATHNHPLNKPIQFDSKNFVRFSCPHSNNRSNRDVVYKIFTDHNPGGYFQCWYCGISADFSLKNKKELSSEEAKAFKERLERKKYEDDLRLKKDYEEAAARAKIIWDKTPNCFDHPYLRKKGVKAYNLRLHPNTKILLVPNYNANFELVNLEHIFFDDESNGFIKRPLKGGERNGVFSFIGNPEDKHDLIYLAEGYSTAATIYEATNILTFISFNCGNLPNVARVLKNLYPKAKIVICADRDKKGAGERHAKQAASLTGCTYILPDFSKLNGAGENISDFNDVFLKLIELGFSREAALTEVQLQLTNKINKDLIMLTNQKEKFTEKKPINETILKTPETGAIKAKDYPDLSEKNRPYNTSANLKYLLDRLGISIKWNKMTRFREISIPNFSRIEENEENRILEAITDLAILNHMPISRIDNHLDSVAVDNTYHPIIECIKKKPWDGKSRLDGFIKMIKAKNASLAYKLIRRWMISAIAAAFSEKGISAQGVLVLEGEQNIGKSRWVESLDPIHCDAVKEGATLDPTCKDSILRLARYWIVELGELDGTFRKADIARLKSHITNSWDEVRAAYARKNTRIPRRTVYVATVNVNRFLVDDTGNRRWWTIEVESINLSHGLDMQQVWAEVYDLWVKGEQIWLTIDEFNELNITNVEHEQIDPFEEKVLTQFNWLSPIRSIKMTATDVLCSIGYERPNRSDATRMGKILMKLTKGKPIKQEYGNVYLMPPKNFGFEDIKEIII